MMREPVRRTACLIPMLLALGLSLVACAPEDLLQGPDDKTPEDMTTAQKTQFEGVSSFLATSCAMANCHDGSSSFVPRIEGGVNATPAQVKAALEGISSGAGAPLIAPNDADNSVLWRRLIGTPAFMPPGPGLAMDKIQPVKDWINAGAKFELSSGMPDMGGGGQDMKGSPDMGAADDMGGGNLSPEFTEVVRIMRGCAESGCHDGAAFTLPKIEGGTMASPAQITAALQDKASAQDATTTLINMIFLRISGTEKGSRMPFGRAPLPQADIDAYKAWLDAGANFK